MIKIIICGVSGRMGRRIAYYASLDKDVTVVGGIERSDSEFIGQDIGVLAGVNKMDVVVTDSLEAIAASADVVIDFTAPVVSVENARICHNAGTAIVIGTTGMTEDQVNSVKECKDKIACMVSPNMSVGVNLVFSIAAKIAAVLQDSADVEITEIHHRMKKDSPSGTAVKLAEVIADAMNRDLSKDAVYGRQGIVGERKDGEIGIHAIRGGDVVGEHTAAFYLQNERIELTHKAHTRDIFASGAVRTAKFLAAQSCGYYTMQDSLNI